MVRSFRKHLNEKLKDEKFQSIYAEEKGLTHEEVKQELFKRNPQLNKEYDALEDEYKEKSEEIKNQIK
ncbi:hypothetical protein KAJ27_13515 [bacterium]|nr:hypothetical protein [Bacteroidales bacterium]MCK5685141.1 hypothetical protein [bacterium]